MPPLAISRADLSRLVAITAEAIVAAHASAYETPNELMQREDSLAADPVAKAA